MDIDAGLLHNGRGECFELLVLLGSLGEGILPLLHLFEVCGCFGENGLHVDNGV